LNRQIASVRAIEQDLIALEDDQLVVRWMYGPFVRSQNCGAAGSCELKPPSFVDLRAVDEQNLSVNENVLEIETFRTVEEWQPWTARDFYQPSRRWFFVAVVSFKTRMEQLAALVPFEVQVDAIRLPDVKLRAPFIVQGSYCGFVVDASQTSSYELRAWMDEEAQDGMAGPVVGSMTARGGSRRALPAAPAAAAVDSALSEESGSSKSVLDDDFFGEGQEVTREFTRWTRWSESAQREERRNLNPLGHGEELRKLHAAYARYYPAEADTAERRKLWLRERHSGAESSLERVFGSSLEELAITKRGFVHRGAAGISQRRALASRKVFGGGKASASALSRKLQDSEDEDADYMEDAADYKERQRMPSDYNYLLQYDDDVLNERMKDWKGLEHQDSPAFMLCLKETPALWALEDPDEHSALHGVTAR